MQVQTKAVRALPIRFLDPEAFADFRSDPDVPPETPWTPEEFAAFEAWLESFHDVEGQATVEEVQTEMETPELDYKPNHDFGIPF